MKKILILNIVLLLALSIFATEKHKLKELPSLGAHAIPGLTKFSQPDGTSISIYLKGNRAVNWALTKDGYTLLKKNGGYYYATFSGELSCSDLLAHDETSRSIEEKQFIQDIPKGIGYSSGQITNRILKYTNENNRANLTNTTFPTTGERKLIAILVGFKDVPFSYSREEFNKMFNQPDYTENGATGSVYDFFYDNSFGQLDLVTEVVGPYTISENREYYGGEDDDGNDKNTRAMVGEAVVMADADVDFSDFDNDGDGIVDGVYIIFANYGEEAGGPSEAIWSHKYSLTNQIRVDGVSVAKYSCSPELQGNNGNNRTNIGVICHEFGHVLGLPDYYDVDYSESGGQSFDIGDWDIMASGSWNNGGATPPYYNSYSRYLLGWQNLDTITANESFILGPNHEYNQAYYIPTKTENEFFILENRQNMKWDSYIPGHGMLIFHVDRNNTNGWLYNRINVNPEDQGFDLIEADNSKTEGSVSGDPFPGTSGVFKFTDTSNPSAVSKDGTPTEIPVTNIRENNKQGIIYFDVLGGKDPAISEFVAIPRGENIIEMNWQNGNGKNIVVARGLKPFVGDLPINIEVGAIIANSNEIIYKGTGTNLTDELSTDEVVYSIWVQEEQLFKFIDYSQIIFPDIAEEGEEYIYDFETFHDTWGMYSEGGKNWQSWEVGSFFQGISGRGNFAYLNSDNYGENGAQNTSLLSPIYEFSKGNINTFSIEFDHYYKHTSGSQINFYYSVDKGATWQLLQNWTSTIGTKSTPVTSSYDLSNIANQHNSIQFKWNFTGEYGYFWCIDPVKVTKELITNASENTNTILDISIYPIPAIDELNLFSTKSFVFSITNVQGVCHLTKEFEQGTNTIDISNFEPGVYFAIIKMDESQEVRKIIIK